MATTEHDLEKSLEPAAFGVEMADTNSDSGKVSAPGDSREADVENLQEPKVWLTVAALFTDQSMFR